MVGYGWAAGAHIGALELIDRFEVAAVCTSRDDIDAAELERRTGGRSSSSATSTS